MRRADRLFQIVQLLRVRATITAAEIARELEVSERTIYRDIQDLIGSGVPIEGEAGVGYALAKGFHLPPLMFTEDEIEALVAGARMIEAWGGPSLARHARSLLQKAESVLPERLRERLRSVGIYAVDFHVRRELTINIDPVRHAIADRRKLRFRYQRIDTQPSERTVRPLGLYFWGTAWTLVAWCELRRDFRNFRPDRMSEVSVLDDAIPDEPGRDLATFLKQMIEGDRRRGRE